MSDHRMRVEIEDGGIHFSVVCPFDPEDRSRPCWPTQIDSDGEPEPESDECVYVGWCDNLCPDEWHHGLVTIECDAEFDWHYDSPSVRLSSPVPVPEPSKGAA